MTTDQNELIRAAVEKIEGARKARNISVRTAVEKIPNISESYWRQFVAGGLTQSGIWIPRIPSVDQVLKMAAAVGMAAEVASDLGTELPEQSEAVIDRSELEQLKTDLIGILERIDRLQRG